MSKYLKNLVCDDISRRLSGVQDALLANMVGLNSDKTFLLRKRLRSKNIHVLVVRNSLAARATEGTPLGPAFTGVEGSLAVVWGGEDFISLAKEITELDGSEEFPQFKTRGGVMDGEQLSPEKVAEISKWPNRQQQLSMLVGQILSPGANLAAALLGPGAALASQVKKKSEGEEGDAPAPAENPA